MRSLRCLIGHHWEVSVAREEGGERSVRRRCTRCGTQRVSAPSRGGRAMPGAGDRTTSRPPGADGWDVGG